MANGTRWLTPDTSAYYIGVDNMTGDVVAYNYTVVKATPTLNIGLGSLDLTSDANVLVSGPASSTPQS